jgi:hypothetical protein
MSTNLGLRPHDHQDWHDTNYLTNIRVYDYKFRLYTKAIIRTKVETIYVRSYLKKAVIYVLYNCDKTDIAIQWKLAVYVDTIVLGLKKALE